MRYALKNGKTFITAVTKNYYDIGWSAKQAKTWKYKTNALKALAMMRVHCPLGAKDMEVVEV